MEVMRNCERQKNLKIRHFSANRKILLLSFETYTAGGGGGGGGGGHGTVVFTFASKYSVLLPPRQ